MGLDILVYFIAGLVVLIVLINILGKIRPATRRYKPQQRVAVHATISKPQHNTVMIDADLCKQYPLIDTAYKNGYRFVSYNPLIMELRE